MKKKAYVMMMAAALLCAGGCRKEQQENPHAEAERLYREICKLTASYTDSIRNAPDSTTVYALLERFEESLDSVNYTVVPDTDFNLDEGENDTISMALDSLIKVRVERLTHLAAIKVAATDSTAADSAAAAVVADPGK